MGGSVKGGDPPSLVKSCDLKAITCKQPRHNVRTQVAAALHKTSILIIQHSSQQSDPQHFEMVRAHDLSSPACLHAPGGRPVP